MVSLLQLRLGISHDPTALPPTLNDCIEAMLQQAEPLMNTVLEGLVLGAAPSGPRKIAAFQQPPVKQAIERLNRDAKALREGFRAELSRTMYEGGGKEQVQAEALRFDDLQLFEDAQLDQSIELARAQQEVGLAVDDVLPTLDALVSTLLGWRTIQPGLNPVRPDVFVRALQALLAQNVPAGGVREILIAPAASLMGVQLRKLYKELVDWLQSSGVEPAVPLGGRIAVGTAGGRPVNDSVAKTLLTLDKLRKLLAGDFDRPAKPEFLHTVPASMSMLQEMKQVDALVKRLESRPRADVPPAPPEDLLASAAASHEAQPGEAPREGEPPRIGRQLGEEVVRLMFDNLVQDQRLVPQFREALRSMQPAVLKLAESDSRFFSDRNHPARQFLERITQRSLAFSSDADEAWPRFLQTVNASVRWLDSKVVDADTFGELMDILHTQWTQHDTTARARREEAARALLHAEQRNLLAQKLAADFAQAVEGLDVPDFVTDFLKGSWAQVVAEAQLSCTDGSDDPFGYRAVVEDLVWSVQKTTAQRGRLQRLAQLVPGLLARLREGLARIDYPAELTQRFFDNLIVIHKSALEEGRDEAARLAAEAAEAQAAQPVDNENVWLAGKEAQESGFYPDEPLSAEELALLEGTPSTEPVGAGDIRTGTWCELMVGGQWLRVQLTWASPHATLFMFTSLAGTAHSMSRRTLERLRGQGLLRVIAERNVVDEALDQVAKAALRNSLDGGA